MFYVWDISQLKPQPVYSLTRRTSVLSSRTSLAGRLSISAAFLVTGNQDGTLSAWNTSDHGLQQTVGPELLGSSGAFHVECFDNDDHRILYATSQSISVVGLEDEEKKEPFEVLTGVDQVSHVALDGHSCIATFVAGSKMKAELWNFPDWEIDGADDLFMRCEHFADLIPLEI
jgi:hypothetical protein